MYGLRFWLKVMVVFAGVAVCGCDRAEGPVRTEGTETGGNGEGGGTRPGGAAGDGWLSGELADGVWRCVGGSVNLRHDRGGVLVKVGREGDDRSLRRVVWSDLDGTERVELVYAAPGADSVARVAVMKVNGVECEVVRMGMKKTSEDAVWYLLNTASTGVDYMVVVSE